MRRKLMMAAVMLAAALAGAASWWGMARLLAPGDEAVAALLALELPDSEGRPVRFAAWRGKPMVVNFWATWCPPCREEMPLLKAAAEAHPGIQFVGISVDDPASVRKYLAEHPTPYPLPVSGLAITELSRALGNKAGALPFTAFVSAEGRIVDVKLGELKAPDLAQYLSRIAPAR